MLKKGLEDMADINVICTNMRGVITRNYDI